ncbi:olfactory receptor 14I1-like [Tachyglossus aculeatus]|uniref:olfactory receptor 14I1-like n=1 Tax=Tachyglossus aculeatus TaxID=9261 RepID=UPI0018F2B85E|nr:olfactory receptor 14I1-like [Tachyglossus aculeatus]
MSNHTTMKESLLLGFSKVQELQLVHAILFLLVYLAVLTGYLLIIAVMALNQHLHTPMYFFLKYLSILDLIINAATIPKSTFNMLTEIKSISFLGSGGSERFPPGYLLHLLIMIREFVKL